MSFINSSYFIAERNVANKVYGDVASLLSNLINRREREYLIDALGYELFTLLTNAVKEGDPVDQRYLDIIFGVDYVGFNGQKKRWNGLVAVTDATPSPLTITLDGVPTEFDITDAYKSPELVSPVCDFVYFYWLRKKTTQQADVGEVKAEGQNSKNVSPRYRLAAAWNSMVDETCKLREYMLINYAVYPEFQYHSGSRQMDLLLTRLNPFF